MSISPFGKVSVTTDLHPLAAGFEGSIVVRLEHPKMGCWKRYQSPRNFDHMLVSVSFLFFQVSPCLMSFAFLKNRKTFVPWSQNPNFSSESYIVKFLFCFYTKFGPVFPPQKKTHIRSRNLRWILYP